MLGSTRQPSGGCTITPIRLGRQPPSASASSSSTMQMQMQMLGTTAAISPPPPPSLFPPFDQTFASTSTASSSLPSPTSSPRSSVSSIAGGSGDDSDRDDDDKDDDNDKDDVEGNGPRGRRRSSKSSSSRSSESTRHSAAVLGAEDNEHRVQTKLLQTATHQSHFLIEEHRIVLQYGHRAASASASASVRPSSPTRCREPIQTTNHMELYEHEPGRFPELLLPTIANLALLEKATDTASATTATTIGNGKGKGKGKGGSGGSRRITEKRLLMKRYVGRMRLRGSLEEVLPFLLPGELAKHCEGLVHPDLDERIELWRPLEQPQQQQQSPHDDPTPRQQQREPGEPHVTATWVDWQVHKMPSLFTRARDFIVLEHRQTFAGPRDHHHHQQQQQQQQQRGRTCRGVVCLTHSVVAPGFDPGLEHKAGKRLTRGDIHCSGAVATEDEAEPGVVHVTVALEVDFFGSVSPAQHRQLVLGRLGRWAELRELVWKARLGRTPGFSLRPDKIAAGTGPLALLGPNTGGKRPCEICPLRERPGPHRQTGEHCAGCHRWCCGDCSRAHAFPLFLLRRPSSSSSSSTASSSSSSSSSSPSLSFGFGRSSSSEAATQVVVCTLCVARHAQVPATMAPTGASALRP